MATPAKKRRKTDHAPSTLHMFFRASAAGNVGTTKDPPSNGSSNSRRKDDVVNRAQGGPGKPRAPARSTVPADVDVIVIDDTDEDDCEIIEIDSLSTDSQAKTIQPLNKQEESQDSQPREWLAVTGNVEKEGRLDGHANGVSISSCYEECASSSSGSRPSFTVNHGAGCTPPPPDITIATETRVNQLTDNYNLENGADIPVKEDSAIKLEANGEDDGGWESGDDERETGNSEEDTALDDDDDILDGTEAVQTKKGKEKCLGEILIEETEQCSACPLCNQSTFGWTERDIQEHVNICIDLMPDPSTTTKAPVPSPGRALPVSKFAPAGLSSTKKKTGPNAFSLLMSGRKENDAWKDAELDHAKAGTDAAKQRVQNGRRRAPFYKVMQGMPIAVDAFRYGKIPGVTAYFLTHAHSDHYTNLSSSWKNGPIYCSKTTANLILHMLNVDPKWVNPLPENVPTIIPNTGGVEVIVLEANHCPGSSLFLFTGRQTANAGDCDFPSPFVGSQKVFRYLHCGDFRASPRHVMHPAIKDKKIDLVYLDTTYCDAKYCFPPQHQVIDACADLARRLVLGTGKPNPDDPNNHSLHSVEAWANVKGKGKAKEEPIEPCLDPPLVTLPDGASIKCEQDAKANCKYEVLPQVNRILVAVGTYSIGKEWIVKAVAQALSSKIYCDSRKSAILIRQDDPELHSLMTDDPYEAQVHVVPLGIVNLEKIEPYFSKYRKGFTSVLAFRPTGWTYTPPSGADLQPPVYQVIGRNQSRNFTSASLNLMRNSSAKYRLYGVPYSEHSSFFELTCFALSVNAVKMIATVNVGSANSRGKMQKWFDKWDVERKKRFKDGKLVIVPSRTLDYW